MLDRPDIPLHTNGSENDVRSFVTKRRISGETRSAAGKQARDTFLSLLKTCSKLAISFWDYLGARLKIPDADRIPWLPDLIRQRPSVALTRRRWPPVPGVSDQERRGHAPNGSRPCSARKPPEHHAAPTARPS